MACKHLVLALSMIAAAAPVPAASQNSGSAGAPAGRPQTLYCMHIEAITGSRIEEVKCWTRQEWAEQGINLDQEWAREGVRTLG